MSKFNDWLKRRELKESQLGGFVGQATGRNAVPINKGNTPRTVSLSDLAVNVQDRAWHDLYRIFDAHYSKTPEGVKPLGAALYRAAQSGDMSGLMPFKQQYQIR